MPLTLAQYLVYVESLVGVRWNHRGRSRTDGVDCAGLVVVPLREHSIPYNDVTEYGETAYEDTFYDVFAAQMDIVEGGLANAIPGDVALFWLDPGSQKAQHAGVLIRMETGEWGMIHAFKRTKNVTKNHLGRFWEARVKVVLRFRKEMLA